MGQPPYSGGSHPRASVAVMTDRSPAALLLSLLALLSAACGGGGSEGPTTPSVSPTPLRGPARERPLHDRLGGRAAPDLALHLRHEPARLGGPLTRPAPRPAGRQPLDRLQLGDERLERRLRLPPPERRLPGRRRRARRGGAPARGASAGGRGLDDRHRAHGRVRVRRQVAERRREPDPGLPERPVPRVASREAPRLLLPARHRRPRRLPGRVRGLARVGLPRRAPRPRADALLLARQRAGPLGLHPRARSAPPAS